DDLTRIGLRPKRNAAARCQGKAQDDHEFPFVCLVLHFAVSFSHQGLISRNLSYDAGTKKETLAKRHLLCRRPGVGAITARRSGDHRPLLNAPFAQKPPKKMWENQWAFGPPFLAETGIKPGAGIGPQRREPALPHARGGGWSRSPKRCARLRKPGRF